jgi:hypothetical protein
MAGSRGWWTRGSVRPRGVVVAAAARVTFGGWEDCKWVVSWGGGKGFTGYSAALCIFRFGSMYRRSRAEGPRCAWEVRRDGSSPCKIPSIQHSGRRQLAEVALVVSAWLPLSVTVEGGPLSGFGVKRKRPVVLAPFARGIWGGEPRASRRLAEKRPKGKESPAPRVLEFWTPTEVPKWYLSLGTNARASDTRDLFVELSFAWKLSYCKHEIKAQKPVFSGSI